MANRIKVDIFAGHLQPGAKLPSVRDFALQIKINPNTVQRSLTMLEQEGLIYTERTNGKYITADTELIAKYRAEYAREITKRYQQQMLEIGMGN